MKKAGKMQVSRKTYLNERNIFLIVTAVLLLVAALSFFIQLYAEKDAFTMPVVDKQALAEMKEGKAEFEIYKLAAEVRQIRSDTGGSLFWLKLVALFVTVGGAVGGYLVAQSTITKKKLRFELRKNIDESYQKIIQELSSAEPILRAASAVKLGGILQSFPEEWLASEQELDPAERREELIQLTKQILAAALAIEKNEKVLKTITIALARTPIEPDETKKTALVDLRKLDLSWANANDAYWADVDFSSADFFRANLAQTSFRRADLTYTQFYHSNLYRAVLSKANCAGTNFKLADLRHADLNGAKINDQTNFEGARVYGMKLSVQDALSLKDKETLVDASRNGDGSAVKRLSQWLTDGDMKED